MFASPISMRTPDFYQSHSYRLAVISKKHKKETTKDIDMLEKIVSEYPHAVLASVIAGATAIIPTTLYILSMWAEKNSPYVEDEDEAHKYFNKVLEHYNLDKSKFELRCTHRKDTHYIKKIKDKYVVFFNMKKHNRQCYIQHEIEHYVNGDMRLDPDNLSFFKKMGAWALYLTYLEPRAIIKTRKSRI